MRMRGPMRTATRPYEVRVWNETADLLGLWEVQHDGGQYVVTHDHREETRFDDEGDALNFARFGAEALVETSRRDCPCEGDPECGFWEPHGISIQEVEAELSLITPPLLCL
ncbi:hypothetical protein LKL35_26280 [Streptomyces sp. ET3-23]|uniref:hypothetical protein n=1 Tax=Streptomyces sp. ET3-23 TaxID=2885643 RepID=UPI001D123E3C|nr:hypothetical protein [Streptomyces sp. ET3-23]MCC2278908.1 hypothetical protein [Streptomyces sp. ET3-23]